MFNNVAIDVCLGIIFIVLLYSLLSSIVQEIIARWLGLRARLLQKAIRRMLEDGDSKWNSTFINFFIDLIDGFVRYFKPLPQNTITRTFYEYPLIKYLGENNWNSKPSYIPARNFSQTVIQLLRGEGYNGTQNQMDLIYNNIQNRTFRNPIDDHTLRYIRKMWIDSNHDIDRFDALLQNWYNDTMMRVTGWYKRQTQLLLFLIGFFIAWSFNVDLIAITQILANNNTIREQVVNVAISRKEDYARIIDSQNRRQQALFQEGKTDSQIVVVAPKDTITEKILNGLRTDAVNMQKILGLGYEKECTEQKNCIKSVDVYKDSLQKVNTINQETIKELYKRYAACKQCVEKVSPYQQTRSKFWGWLLTALAISLGAPFWFDLLNKFMQLRSGGVRPANETKDTDGSVQSSNQPPVKPKG